METAAIHEGFESGLPGAFGPVDFGAGATAQLTPHLAGLRARARRLERDPADADDLVQDTVERALRGWHRFVPGTNLRGWLHTIMQNLFRDRCRMRQRHPSLVADGQENVAVMPADGDGPPAWEGVTLAELEELSLQLGGALRETLRLVCFAGLSYEEASLRLGVPRPTVGTRLVRARARLRKLLMARIEARSARGGWAPAFERVVWLGTRRREEDHG